jgi:uncharacterized protein (DUF2147 family)
MLTRRNAFVALFAAFLLMAGLAPTARAAGDATGTWKYTMPARGNNGTPREITLKLKQDGEKLTGTVAMPGRGANAAPTETEIADGKIKDGELSFKVTRKGQNGEVTSNYTGKLDGDVIKGKVETNFNGTPRSTDFEAKRAKE